LAKNRDWG